MDTLIVIGDVAVKVPHGPAAIFIGIVLVVLILAALNKIF
jgi:hypothetical protein